MDEDPQGEPTIPGLIGPSRGAVPTYNEKHDAPTIVVDAVQGAMLSTEGVKISFVEHFLTDDFEIRGRYVVNLRMSKAQMLAIGNLFINLSGHMDQTLASESSSGE